MSFVAFASDFAIYYTYCDDHYCLKHLLASDSILLPLNWSIFFTFQISQIHFIHFYFFPGVSFDFIAIVLPLFFLPNSRIIIFQKNILCFSSNAHNSIAFYILWHLCTNQLYIFVSKQLKIVKFLLLSEGPCNPNCGWLHDIQGEFGLHGWISDPLASCKNHAIEEERNVEKNLLKQIINHTYNKL